MSGVTVARRAEELVDGIEKTLKECVSQFVYHSIALHKITTVSDTTQPAELIHGIDVNFVVIEELVALVSMKGSVRWCDLLESFIAVINRYYLKLSNFTVFSTDGAPSMVDKNEGFIALIKKKNPDVSFVQYRRIIHQENLFAKSVNIQNRCLAGRMAMHAC